MLPALAIQTAHSLGEGSVLPAGWTAVLDRLHGGASWRVLVADRDDLASLPAAIAAWGRERLAIGALIDLPLTAADERDVLLIAPTAAAYARLCVFLSLRHEEPEAVSRWLGLSLGAGGDEAYGPDLRGLVALVRDQTLGALLREAGADVRWHCHTPEDAFHAGGFAPLALALLAHPTLDGRLGEPIRRAVALTAGSSRRGGCDRVLRAALPAADDCATLVAAFADRLDLLLAGHELLASCSYVPDGRLHLPPSLHPEPERVLRERAEQGAEARYGHPLPTAARARLEEELAVIGRKGFAGYILTVADLAGGRRTCGRGSAASSLICYALGLTNVDPLRWKLLFSRFLSDSRLDPPDIDIDFPWDERDAVFAAALATHGVAHVAMVATHNRLRRDGAVRAAARAWGMPATETSAVVDQLTAQRRYSAAVDVAEPWPGILAAAAHLVGLPLHHGLHCGGLVITREPLRELVPVHRAAKEIEGAAGSETVPAIAWEKDGAEAMGLVKIDILGNRSLAVIRDCVDDLHEQGIHLDEARWQPADDLLTREVVGRGATLGCFYIESPAMRQLQAQAGSGDFEHLVIHSSIIRPAANKWIHEYVRRLHHHRTTGEHLAEWYPHPALRGLLSDTFGIMSYQEDVMLVARAFAGFDEAGANRLRKALGHWDTQNGLLQYRAEFCAGAAALGAEPGVIATVWDMIASFAGYSFAKAHSASFAMVSFQCAWLKAHFPACFLARVVANEGGFYGPSAYFEEARRLGCKILGPCVMASTWKTRAEPGCALRVGLQLLPGLGRAAAELIARERERGAFIGVGDFTRRCRIPIRLLETLARAGALDALRPDLHRHQLCWLAQTLAFAALHRHRAEEPGTQWLFAQPPNDDPPVPVLPVPLLITTAWERFQILGFCPEAHPVRFFQRPDAWRAHDLPELAAGTPITLTAWAITRKQVAASTASGGREPMAFVTLEDDTGLIETVWFPAAYRAAGAFIDRQQPMRIHGVVEEAFGCRTVTVERAEAVNRLPG